MRPDAEVVGERYPRYVNYRASGIAGLDRVPVHWKVTRNSALFQERRQKGYAHLPVFSVTQDRGVIPQSEVNVRVVTPSEDRTNYNRIVPGDLVYNKMRMWQGAVGTADAEGIVSPAYVVCRPIGELVTRYYEYLYRTPLFISLSGRYSYGICDDMNSLRWRDLKAVPSLEPPLDEQYAIADFLDRETAKIDRLIEEKQRLIELLEEKQTALITQAVTKGLDPDVEMKDSGVEWLGEIPAHWDVVLIKRAARLESGHTPDKKIDAYWKDGDIPWVSLADSGWLREHDRIAETAYYTNRKGIENSSARLLPSGAVVFSRDATVGLAAIATKPMTVSQHFIAWICGEDLRPGYLLHAIYAMRQELEKLSMGATIATIGMPEVKNLKMPLPPLQEQAAMVEFLLRSKRQLDETVTETRRAIDLLVEYRSALISAAVTGKIDVREEAA